MNPYRTPSDTKVASTRRSFSISRLGFAGNCFGASSLVAFFLYAVVSYLRLGNTGGDSYIVVPIAALIVGCLSWLVSLPLFSLAKTHAMHLAACSGAMFVSSLVYLVLVGAFATNPPFIKPLLPWTVGSLLLAPLSTGLIAALNALHSRGSLLSKENAG